MDQTVRSHSSTLRVISWLAALWMVVVLSTVSSANAAAAGRAKRVLMISTGSRFSPGFGIAEQSALKGYGN